MRASTAITATSSNTVAWIATNDDTKSSSSNHGRLGGRTGIHAGSLAARPGFRVVVGELAGNPTACTRPYHFQNHALRVVSGRLRRACPLRRRTACRARRRQRRTVRGRRDRTSIAVLPGAGETRTGGGGAGGDREGRPGGARGGARFAARTDGV